MRRNNPPRRPAAALRALTLAAGLALALPGAARDDALALKAALLGGDHTALAALLADGADPNARLPDASLPLAWAADLQDAHAARLLIDHGATPDDASAGGNDFGPLLVACLNPDEAVLDALLDAGADVTARVRDGVPVLAVCAAHAPAAVVARMVDAGAPVDAAGAAGQTALMWAAAHDRAATFDALVERGADVNRRSEGGFTPLAFAIKSGSAAMAERALAAGGDVDHVLPDGTTTLQLALYQGNTGFARRLVERGAVAPAALAMHDVNGRQPLHVAVLAGDGALVDTLVAAGADVNAITTPSEKPWKYESNFRAGAYEFPLRPPLALAARAGHADLVRRLHAAGAETDWRDENGDTALHLAVQSGTPEAVAAVLEVAPDANVVGARGETPLHRAVKRVRDDALETMLALLAEHGARADLTDENGETPAQLAADEHFKGREAFAALFTTAEDSGP